MSLLYLRKEQRKVEIPHLKLGHSQEVKIIALAESVIPQIYI